MNTAAILALIGDLYQQIVTLKGENDQLRAALEQSIPTPAPPADPNPHANIQNC